jgi:hypothetical protein
MGIIQIEPAGEPLIGLRPAARMLGMGRVTVSKMARCGQIPTMAFPMKGGKFRYMFRVSELEAYLATLRRPLQEKAS